MCMEIIFLKKAFSIRIMKSRPFNWDGLILIYLGQWHSHSLVSICLTYPNRASLYPRFTLSGSSGSCISDQWDKRKQAEIFSLAVPD
jgi:hypothetical protein